MTTTYRYLGYGVTNNKGVAKLDHDAQGNPITHSYTGTGAGKVDIVASLDDSSHISESSIQSEIYELMDCYKMDIGTTSNHSDIWTLNNTDLTRSDEYTTIKEKTVGTTAYCTITNIPLTNYRIEVDVFQVDGNSDEWVLTVLNNDYSSVASANAKLNEWKHISVDVTNVATNSRIRLNTGGTATEMRFKNFQVYPI